MRELRTLIIIGLVSTFGSLFIPRSLAETSKAINPSSAIEPEPESVRATGSASGTVFSSNAEEQIDPSLSGDPEDPTDPVVDPAASPTPSPGLAPVVPAAQGAGAAAGATAQPAAAGENSGGGGGGAPQMPQIPMTPEMQREQGRFNRFRDRGANDGQGNYTYNGDKNYAGTKCSLPNLDYSKFNKAWGKALLDRMSGAEPVKTENGFTLDGGFDLSRTADALAKDIGCQIDRDDTDSKNALVAAVVIAISCPESGGWNPTTKYDERLSGGVAGSDRSREANESRGLLQMTRKSDMDSENGCHLRSQADLDGPITNLMCGLAKIKKRRYTTLSSFSEYWSVARTMTKSIRAAVKRECDADFRNIKGYIDKGGDAPTAPAAPSSPGGTVYEGWL